jgi:hypothetical protein
MNSLDDQRHAVAEATKVFLAAIETNEAVLREIGDEDVFVLAWGPTYTLGVGYYGGQVAVVGLEKAFRFRPGSNHPLLSAYLRNGADEKPELIDLKSAVEANTERLRSFIARLNATLEG